MLVKLKGWILLSAFIMALVAWICLLNRNEIKMEFDLEQHRKALEQSEKNHALTEKSIEQAIRQREIINNEFDQKTGNSTTLLGRRMILAALLFLMMSSGCSSTAPKPKTLVFCPPAILLDDVKIPSRQEMKTVGDMARLILADEQAMKNKNADMQALREYRAGLLMEAAKK